MKKLQLKSLIKECIQEVISEEAIQQEFPFDDEKLESSLRNLLADPRWPNFEGALRLAKKYQTDKDSMDLIKNVINQAISKREAKYKTENSKLVRLLKAFGGSTSIEGGRHDSVKQNFKKYGIDLDK